MEHKEEKVLQEENVNTETAKKGQPKKLWHSAHKDKTRYMTTLAMMIALVAVLQFLGAMIPPIGPTTLSFVLIPIVIGGMVLGVKAGAVLGLSFGLVTIIFGLTGLDPFTAGLMYYNNQTWSMVGTLLLCLIKAVVCGTVGAVTYQALHKRLPRASIVITAAIVPVINTSIFAVGSLFLLEPLTAMVGNVAYFLGFSILVCNFLPELAINLIAAPAIYRVAQVVSRKKIH